jgi:hypothetical protein
MRQEDYGLRKCNGNNTQEWGVDAIFVIECKNCGNLVEFFKDDITRNCSECGKKVINDRDDYGCGQWCSSSSSHIRNICSKFKKSKDRSYGHVIA